LHSDSYRLGLVEDKLTEIRAKALPDYIPENTLDFIKVYRPMLGRQPLNFDNDPFWREPLLDDHPHQMYINGRQTYKTTNCSTLIAEMAIRKPGCEVTYVADDDNHRTAFSEKRLREETFLANPQLERYLPHGKANVGRIKLLNGSTIYLVTDENKYHAVEGHSNAILVLDETQAQDVGFLPVAMYSLSKTHGRFYCFGIGGEAGSPYYKMWKRTDQREWTYDDPNWRDKLLFDAFGQFTNSKSDLQDILKGKWVAQNPKNTTYRGYHFPQRMFPHIPLTIDDAVNKYHIQPEISIEYQEKHYPHSMFMSHCEGLFYKAERRPITPEMVEKCYVNYMKLLPGIEVRDLKAIYGNEIVVLGGVDFGSGPAASKTVISIIIHWRKTNRFQLVWIDPRPAEHAMDQARYIADLFHDYDVDYAVGDWGYGQDKIPLIQDGGRDSMDNKFLGIGQHRFMGCQTLGNEIKQNADFNEKYDEEGNEDKQRLMVDKTTVIQNFVDFIGMSVAHPLYPHNEKFKQPMFIIPHYYDWQTDFLMDDLTSITRKDLEEVQEVKVEDPRQKAMKTYNHPTDSVMSIIYCLVADTNYNPSAYVISPIRRKSRV
jgi:hypothetical protein